MRETSGGVKTRLLQLGFRQVTRLVPLGPTKKDDLQPTGEAAVDALIAWVSGKFIYLYHTPNSFFKSNPSVMALFSKVFSCLSRATGGTIRRFYSVISSPQPLPGLAVEELKNRHGFGPWLMFADAENDKRDPLPAGGGFRRCYSFASGEIFSLPAPHLQGRRCWGTQYGWLFTFCPSNCHVDLFNPLTRHKLPLPSYNASSTSFFHGFSFSSDSDRLVVMSMYGGCSQLAFSSPGDEAWKYLSESDATLSDDDDLTFDDVNLDTIFYRGQFYSIDCGYRLKAYDIISGKPREKLIATFDDSDDKYGSLYLVEISGHLHLICGYYIRGDIIDPDFSGPDDCPHNYFLKAKYFDIYRFDFQENKWISIEHLNGHTLFVGNNTTFAISAADYPEINPNCIYFTDDFRSNYIHPFCNTGVYDFANKSLVEPVPFIKGDNSPYSKISRPFFFIPSLSDL